MYPFSYHRAQTLDDATSLLTQGDDPLLLAGGQTILPTMKQRLAMPSDLIDVGHLSELKGISVDGSTIRVGAGEKHADVANSPEVQKHIPGLAALAGHIGDPHVRYMGTLGGSIANNDPSADYPAACLGLGATIHTNRKSILADDFFKDLFETALEPGDIITHVTFPIPDKSGYAKFPNPASRYAIVGVYVALTQNAARLAVTGAGPVVFRVPDMETALSRSFDPKVIESIKISPDGLNQDLHATAEYRAHLVTVMAKRAVSAALVG